MITDHSVATNELVQAVRAMGMDLSTRAGDPLKRIKFNELVGVMDHNERFLREVFLESLEVAVRARARAADSRVGSPNVKDVSGRKLKVTKADVSTALKMLGAAVRAAGPTEFDESEKRTVSSACPYCDYGN